MIEAYLRAKKAGGRYAGKPASEQTIKAYRTALVAAERLVEKPLESFTTFDGDTLLQRFEEEGYAPAYRANILAAVRGFFDWLIAQREYTGVHPLLGIETPRIERTIPTILSKDQLHAFFSAIHHPKYKLFFRLMYYGGMRIGEVTKLQKKDIISDGIIVRGKGNKQRFVYLPDFLQEELRAFVATHTATAYVFYAESANACNDQPISLVHAREIFQRAKETCGFEQLHPHNLRASSATHFHETTGDLALTQTFLGHARPETTMIYTQIANSRLRNASRTAFNDAA